MKAKALLLLRLAVGAVFVWSGFVKLMEPYQNFLVSIERYRLVEGQTAKFIAISFPWIEFVGGVFLVLGLWPRVSLALLWLSNTAFLAATGSAIWRRLPIEDCGCFGEAVRLSLHQTFALDLVLWVGFLVLALSLRFGTMTALLRKGNKL